MLAARDPLGMRPLYLVRLQHAVMLGSSPDILLASGEHPRSLSRPRVADYLVPALEGANLIDTFYEGVERLPPGHLLTVAAGQVEVVAYKQPCADADWQFTSEAEAAAALRTVLADAVGERLTGSGDVAAMLSGGLDSSLLACIARSRPGGPARRLTTIAGTSSREIDCPDPYYITQVQNVLGAEALGFSTEELADYGDSLAAYYDNLEEPFDGSMTLTALTYLTAKRAGFSAVIDGVDGDLVASLGDAYLGRLVRDLDWKTAWQEYSAMGEIWREEVGWPGLFRYTLLPDLSPAWVKSTWRAAVRKRKVAGLQRQAMLSDRFAREVGLAGRITRGSGTGSRAPAASMREIHERRLANPALIAGIERYGRVARLCSVTRLSPLLDSRVVEFCLRLPWYFKVRDGQSKVLFRHLLRQEGLNELAERHDNYGLGWEFTRQWMLNNRERDRHLLARHEDRLAEFLDMDAFRRASTAYFSSANLEDDRIWRVIHLLRWLTLKGL